MITKGVVGFVVAPTCANLDTHIAFRNVTVQNSGGMAA
jgi:hypothetical protein